MTPPVLDNPVWHALTGPQSQWAIRRGHACRFEPEVAPFFAIDAPSVAAYRDLGAILADAAEARLFRPQAEDAPPGWIMTFAKPIAQMVLPESVPLEPPRHDVVALGAGDAGDIVALARRARPGPVLSRTCEVGAFLGVKAEGRLAAMAGERMRLPGHVEISAVATDPDFRGRGYARSAMLALAARIRAAGGVPFLHVFPDQAPAVALYRALGFVERCRLRILWLAPA